MSLLPEKSHPEAPDSSPQLPRAQARLAINVIVVDRCPYCARTHRHSPAADGALQRMADCFSGEYILDFSTQPGHESTGRA